MDYPLVDIITSLLNVLLDPLVNAYGLMLEGFPLNILSYIISAIMLALFMQAVFMMLPPLKSIVDSIMFPFRIIHVWLHVQEARKIIEENRAKGTLRSDSLQFASYFATGLTMKEEKTGMALTGMCKPREASRIASAPLKGALVLLLGLVLLTPFLRTSFIGKLIHLYIFIGIATASFPSASDYKFTYNMVLVNFSISAPWILLPVAAFVASFIIVISFTGNIIFAIIWGISMATTTTWITITVVSRKLSKVDSNTTETRVSYSTEETESETVFNTSEPYNNSYLLYQLEGDQ
ncbi:MAG: hypothetical protein ACXACB_08740 [Promethearchaeota archaeon]